jgi:Na+-translocating ferredoxin:NAD+ oxidoreductase subunit E
MKKMLKVFLDGIFKSNPTFVIILGMCPTLALSTSMRNAIGMGIAASFVLICSNVFISLLRKLIPDNVRIPAYITVIAAFVIIVELVMKAYFPALNASLGIYIPLIVVNCIILGRAEAFAAKNSVLDSLMDGIGSGVGFTLAMLLIAFFREILGNGSFWDIPISSDFKPMLIFILPAGAFFTMGTLLAFFNYLQGRKKK